LLSLISKHALSFLSNVVAAYQNPAAAQERKITIDPGSCEVVLTTDPSLLWRVLSNMIKNALEAISTSQMVTVGCTMTANTVEFTVHNPTYMPREAQLQVFQRSFSTKGNGRGLGTYGMRMLSERYLQGEVSFTSTKEEGTTFTACYPLKLKV
jgi:signal transduction histidine kinase